MTTTEDSPTAAQMWFASAFELANLPPVVTANMRQQHRRGPGGRCAGPHGAVPVAWPCSTRKLAETADEIRERH